MKKINKFLVLLAISLFLVSCSNDNDDSNASLGAYDNGYFVVNEGTNAQNSSITFVSNSGTVEQDVFKNVNPTAVSLGAYLQPIFFDDTRAFIISGQANKITVVDRYTFKFIATIDTNLASPRFGAVVNGKAYVTNYNDFSIGTDDFLTVINLSDYTTTKVALNNWSEKITSENGKLYIFNGYYGQGTSVTVFNPNTNTTEKVIQLADSPNSFDEKDGTLYVLGSEKLTKINLATNEITGTPVTLPEAQAGAKNLTIQNNNIYYTVDKSVFAMNSSATTFPSAALFSYTTTSGFGAMYGFGVKNDKILIADAGDFTADSKLYQYSLTGTLLNTLNAGIGADGFYFND